MSPGPVYVVLLAIVLCDTAAAQVTVLGKVVDENGVAVNGARVDLNSGNSIFTANSDVSGAFTLGLERAGEYGMRASRPGFFQFNGKPEFFREGENQLTITLNHLREFAESVDVVYSPPTIDYDEPAERKQLNNIEIQAVPYPAPQDYRNALPLMNGVVQDVNGRLHFNGGASGQTNFTLNGFNISDPVTGRLETRLNIDSVQSLDLESARFSTDRGRGSAGSLDVKSKMGDDRWRFATSNFVPSVSTDGGLHVNKWTPRVEFSGPLVKSRVWFHNGFDAFYDVNTVDGLPRGEDRNRGLTTSNLSRFQINLTPANILTGSFLFNFSTTDHFGLSFQDPLETTTFRRQNLYMTTLKDQIYLEGGTLLELGFADSRTEFRQVPKGTSTFEITPFGQRGNYFVNSLGHTNRQEFLSNVFLPQFRKLGTHQLKIGIDVERSAFDQQVARHDYEVLRDDLSVARYVTFAGNPFLERRNLESSQYVQDRWVPRDDMLIEAGLRTDWNEIIRDVLWSPRVSVAWAPRALKDTKIAGGIGVFYDALLFSTMSQHLDQVSYSTFYLPSGVVSHGPVETAFLMNEHALQSPRYRSASFSVERKLPFDLYGKASYTRRRGTRGLTFVNQLPGPYDGGMYLLKNLRQDRYDALELSVRRTFAGRYEWSAGYTRSSARTNAAVDYNLENPIFGPQGPGPLVWDTPHRFLMWGWVPVSKRLLPKALGFVIGDLSAAYLVEYRTGFPFTVMDEDGFMVGHPNSRRYPDYFNINFHLERRFRALHYLWAWRFGFNNITNNGNPNTVNNNIDSPMFLTYGRGQVRAFSVRLRFLGKK